MKKYYFLMETKLAQHLGMEKDELHNAIKTDPNAGFAQTVDLNGRPIYESVEFIMDEKTMMARIVGFQKWASLHFDYSFEPFQSDTHELPTPDELGLNFQP